MSRTSDTDAFGQVVSNMIADFQDNPFQYANEDAVVPELYHQLRNELQDCCLSVEFRTDYPESGDGDLNWRVRKLWNRVDKASQGQVSRVRREVSFVKGSSRWEFQSSNPDFDIAVFSPDGKMVGQSKQEGPGEFWDSSNHLSILCEVKHSKNSCGTDFYQDDKGASDIRTLAAFPGNVEKRVFLFFDWWPVNGNERIRYEDYRERLEERISELDNPVEVKYIPRPDEIAPTETDHIGQFTLS